mmetsp:Transcript_21412/g.67206  ORF Transcript_21412/g.67206 Transcript_21412/m.67206 type:complete len:379 (+) Transcript_21412:558-1694(+)
MCGGEEGWSLLLPKLLERGEVDVGAGRGRGRGSGDRGEVGLDVGDGRRDGHFLLDLLFGGLGLLFLGGLLGLDLLGGLLGLLGLDHGRLGRLLLRLGLLLLGFGRLLLLGRGLGGGLLRRLLLGRRLALRLDGRLLLGGVRGDDLLGAAEERGALRLLDDDLRRGRRGSGRRLGRGDLRAEADQGDAEPRRGDAQALGVARRQGELVLRRFLGGERRRFPSFLRLLGDVPRRHERRHRRHHERQRPERHARRRLLRLERGQRRRRRRAQARRLGRLDRHGHRRRRRRRRRRDLLGGLLLHLLRLLLHHRRLLDHRRRRRRDGLFNDFFFLESLHFHNGSRGYSSLRRHEGRGRPEPRDDWEKKPGHLCAHSLVVAAGH